MHRRRLRSGAIVLVHTLHVVEEVVATREAVARHSTLAVPEVAKVWPGAMTMHAMRFPLVTEKACSRRELHADAGLLVAAERLQVRVDVFAVMDVRGYVRIGVGELTRSCT